MNKIKVAGKIKKMNSMLLVTAPFITQVDLFFRIMKLETYKNHLTSVV
jgi:hypothetical protein